MMLVERVYSQAKRITIVCMLLRDMIKRRERGAAEDLIWHSKLQAPAVLASRCHWKARYTYGTESHLLILACMGHLVGQVQPEHALDDISLDGRVAFSNLELNWVVATPICLCIWMELKDMKE